MRRAPLLFGIGLAVLLLMIPIVGGRRPAPVTPSGTLTCLLPAKDSAFQRALVEVFARENALDVRFLTEDWSVDSLLSGAADMMVVSGLEEKNGVAFSAPFSNGTRWAVRDDETGVLLRMDRWIERLTDTRHFNRMRLNRSGNPTDLRAISQYDSLIRDAADSIGWDWRLLAAVIYHESRFNNGAISAKGARGLMQIYSSKYSPQELSKPEVNIYVGSRYLKMLEERYGNTGPTEAVKFAIAAYNLGDARVESLVSRAGAAGKDTTRWNEVSTLLPRGHQTISFVDKVLDTYACYSQLYPK
ncbi:MAG: transglycosylase SLT domain-containing protein [Bacteroidales bacterium]|nr:transglycosylase SLT domain-containing protein [Bacteroidales bacterium]